MTSISGESGDGEDGGRAGGLVYAVKRCRFDSMQKAAATWQPG